jgi:hypothetical protein
LGPSWLFPLFQSRHLDSFNFGNRFYCPVVHVASRVESIPGLFILGEWGHRRSRRRSPWFPRQEKQNHAPPRRHAPGSLPGLCGW